MFIGIIEKRMFFMNKTDFCTKLEELFEADGGSLQGEMQIEQIPGWCSLVFVGLIAMIDEEYDVTLSPQSLLNGQTVNGLYALIETAQSDNKRKVA